jgi:hypothetical protein
MLDHIESEVIKAAETPNRQNEEYSNRASFANPSVIFVNIKKRSILREKTTPDRGLWNKPSLP